MPKSWRSIRGKIGVAAFVIGTLLGYIAEPVKMPVQVSLNTPGMKIAVEVESLYPPLLSFNMALYPAQPIKSVPPLDEEGEMLA